MMNHSAFRTSIDLTSAKDLWSINHPIVTIGSCFSDVIGERLERYKFQVLSNPFGTVFNPISIFKLITSDNPSESGFVSKDGFFWHYDYHSREFASSSNDFLKKTQKLHDDFRSYLMKSNSIVITFGTAWIYRLRSNNEIVANCHKSDQNLFTKELLTTDEVLEGFNLAYNYLKEGNPKIKIILTVSPVRHTREGIEQNSLSKSLLRVACHEMSSNVDVDYFPSYEVMIDDLRDYRFYKKDMIHPNETAEDYIWESFQHRYFDANTKKFVVEWSKICSSLDHKPFNTKSAAHQEFVKATLHKLKSFSSLVDTTAEEQLLVQQLI